MSQPQALPAATGQARLRIHPPVGSTDGGGLAAVLRRWRGRDADAAIDEPVPLRVVDLQGRCCLATEGFQAPLELELPAGIYHVMVGPGSGLRRYTVALPPGTTVDLQLRADGSLR